MKTIAIIGVGALGTQTASLLSKENVALLLIDKDKVERRNLGRQILFTKKDLGEFKATQAQKRLHNKNITALPMFLTDKTIHQLKCDLILDCTDNLETRFLINQYSLTKNIPWIFASLNEKEASLFTIIPQKTACFSCLYSGKGNQAPCTSLDPNYAKFIAKFQVKEALSILRKEYTKELRYFHGKKETRFIVKRNPNCSICSKPKKELKPLLITRSCIKGVFEVYSLDRELDFTKLKFKIIRTSPFVIEVNKKEVIVTKHKLLIKETTREEALAIGEKVYESAR